MVMAGMSYRELDRRMNCSYQTIMRLDERHNVTGSANDRVHAGRQRATSAYRAFAPV